MKRSGSICVASAAVGLAGVLCSLAGGAAAQTAPRASAPRPNIVVIMADDMGYSDIGAYGGEIRTPNLDRLAAGGLRFRQFYNNAKCSPSRASLLTGLYPHQAGIESGPAGEGKKAREPGPNQGYLSENSTTVAEALRSAGYRTYMSGKWHLGETPEYWPRRYGFDRYFGLISGANSYFELLQEPGRKRQMVLEDTPWTPPQEGFYATDAFTDYAVERIREHRREHAAQPFFMYVAYTAPHWPLHALPEDIARYRGRYDLGWDRLRQERYTRQREIGLLGDRYALAPRPPSIPAWKDAKNRESWARRMEVYAAMVDRMDQGIGRIVRALEETGMGENTLILFLSDNGAGAENVEGSRSLNDPSVPMGARGSYVSPREPWAYASNTPFRFYKTELYEGGIATPFIAHWSKGIRGQGGFTDEVGHLIDVMPTALELAGATYPGTRDGRKLIPMEGRSLAPAFRGEAAQDRGPLFWAYSGSAVVRQGGWKLLFDADRSKRWELYDLSRDPTELHDVAAERPERFRELRAVWEAWAKRVGVEKRPAS